MFYILTNSNHIMIKTYTKHSQRHLYLMKTVEVQSLHSHQQIKDNSIKQLLGLGKH